MPAKTPAITHLLASISQRWLAETRESLEREGRSLEGGWPGTVSEARRRLQLQLRASGLELSSLQCAEAARAIFREARTQWRTLSANAASPDPVSLDDTSPNAVSANA